jgi:hypothetical protein
MLVEIVRKQRRAVSVVKAALLGAGIRGRAVCVTADVANKNYAVFVSSGVGEPLYESGGSIVDAVKNILKVIKLKDDIKSWEHEVMPF